MFGKRRPLHAFMDTASLVYAIHTRNITSIWIYTYITFKYLTNCKYTNVFSQFCSTVPPSFYSISLPSSSVPPQSPLASYAMDPSYVVTLISITITITTHHYHTQSPLFPSSLHPSPRPLLSYPIFPPHPLLTPSPRTHHTHQLGASLLAAN